MYRCNICDFTSQEGSALLDKPPQPRNTVRWNKYFEGYLCVDCQRSIKDTINEMAFIHEDDF